MGHGASSECWTTEHLGVRVIRRNDGACEISLFPLSLPAEEEEVEIYRDRRHIDNVDNKQVLMNHLLLQR